MTVPVPLDAETRVSMVLSLILLMSALPLSLQLLKRIYENRENCHVLQLSMGWLLMADLLLILNFGPHHLISFASNEFMGGTYCYISGFVSMIMVVFSNVAAAGCAIVTNKSMGIKARAFSSWFREKFVMITAVMFIPGIIYGAILAGTSHVGNYRNLYCCMNDNGEAWVVWGGFVIFFVCASIQAQQYYTSYAYVKEQMQNKSVASSAEDQLVRDQFVAGIRDHALRMAALFYIAWFPMMVTSFISYAHGGLVTDKGVAFPRGVDIFVVLCVKCVPLLDCLVIKRSLDKASINQNKKASLHHSRGDYESQHKSGAPQQRKINSPTNLTNGHNKTADQSKSTQISHESEPLVPESKATLVFIPNAKEEDEMVTASFAEHSPLPDVTPKPFDGAVSLPGLPILSDSAHSLPVLQMESPQVRSRDIDEDRESTGPRESHGGKRSSKPALDKSE
eukprot:gb/GEZN01003032.1/.p1 GENE.gb/GEZN01003032.1/~~gb/GEZN01003032.1/.p1  ORF type:complete len:451 (+),score=71.08 gb/GEZN01003032.1/:54-1406(+)